MSVQQEDKFFCNDTIVCVEDEAMDTANMLTDTNDSSFNLSLCSIQERPFLQQIVDNDENNAQNRNTKLVNINIPMRIDNTKWKVHCPPIKIESGFWYT